MSRRTALFTLAVVLAAGLVAVRAEEPAGASDCAICHEDIVAAYASGPHGLAMAARGESVFEASCAACHGPGDAHLEDPSPETIVRDPDQQACLSCHADSASKIELAGAAHGRHRVSCLDCHDSGHAQLDTDYLLSARPRELCAGCHRTEAGSFRLPYAHREGAQPFDCTDCHSTHGDTRVGRLNLLSGGGVCIDCHTEKAAPRVFPHPPTQRSGCVACHAPHGSTNPRLLTRNSVQLLCLECHAGVPAFHDLSQPRFRNCQTCHAAVHGSNRDPRLIEE